VKRTKLITAFLIVATLVMSATPARADDSINFETFTAISKLSGSQKTLYLAALSLTDYRQTDLTVVAHPDRYREINPALGPHPSREALAACTAVSIAAIALLAQIDHPLTKFAVDSAIASEALNVWENQYAMGKATHIPIMLVFSFNY
jgi:hypothetical protein